MSGPRSEEEVGRAFFASLTSEDFAACCYHRADWPAIARACAEMLGRGVQGDESELYAGAADLCTESGKWFVSLFEWPIAWVEGEAEVADGQHRVCALRAAGARWCSVDPS